MDLGAGEIFCELKFRYARAIFTSINRIIDRYFARPSGQIARRGKDALTAAGSLVFSIFQCKGRERECVRKEEG